MAVRALYFIWVSSQSSGLGIVHHCFFWVPYFVRNVLTKFEKKYEILIECSLKKKESMKKKRFTIPSSDEEDMTRTNLSTPDLNLLLQTQAELKFWGGTLSSYNEMWTTREMAMTTL